MADRKILAWLLSVGRHSMDVRGVARFDATATQEVMTQGKDHPEELAEALLQLAQGAEMGQEIVVEGE